MECFYIRQRIVALNRLIFKTVARAYGIAYHLIKEVGYVKFVTNKKCASDIHRNPGG